MKSRNRNGIVLIVVVVLLPLIGIAMLMLTRQTAQLVVETRQAQQDAELTNLYLSACAYIDANRRSLVRPDTPSIQTLPMDRIADETATASVQVGPSDPSGRTFTLTIHLQTKRKPIQREWTFRLLETIPGTAGKS